MFSLLLKFLERAGTSDCGSITGMLTVLVNGEDDLDELIANAARSILDGHIVLARKLAHRNHYPAIDILQSISRCMPDVVSKLHLAIAGRMKDLAVACHENEDLIQIGAYAQGSSDRVDRAVKIHQPLTAFLQQARIRKVTFALWAGWLWGREAVEPYKIALRRRRYDWAWNATALHAAFSHLFDLLPLGTPFFGLLPEAEPSFLTSALTAAGAAGFGLKSLALRTEHDPVQMVWERGEHLNRELVEPEMGLIRETIRDHLLKRGEPAGYLHLHAAGLIALAESHTLKKRDQGFDEALRKTQSTIEAAVKGDADLVHYSNGESVETGLWDIKKGVRTYPQGVLRKVLTTNLLSTALKLRR